MNFLQAVILVAILSGAVFMAIMIRGYREARKDKDNDITDLKSTRHAKNN